ncbi:MAG TPA: phosphate ABC transporter ATP-binding protein PstB [Gemmatimonadaceae bacterium]|nr:phosphate ABC transporter ATP-binding protein PstB [Gemmatimonadaceae bacterium]
MTSARRPPDDAPGPDPAARGEEAAPGRDEAAPAAGEHRPKVTVRAGTPAERLAAAAEAVRGATLSLDGLSAYFGTSHVVRDVTADFRERQVTAVIGPSGCGKSTLLRCLNRMHETVPGARATGRVLFEGLDIYSKGINPVALRRHIGMVFQRPTPFPTMSIRDNVAAGLRVLRGGTATRRGGVDEIVERALHRAALWDEVRDRLKQSAMSLSGGQQQRLCIARALATDPDVLLLDEPTSSLDPLSTQRVEELVYELRSDITVVIVTHNMQQAARVSDVTAFMLSGELIEVAPTSRLFTTPRDKRTEAYITGRFG